MTGRHGGDQGGKVPVHGLSKHPLHHVWTQMRARCYRKTHAAFSMYGGRGITVCEAWQKDFMAFYRDMIAGYRPGQTLERKDNQGGYSKENCIWVGWTAQARNRRNNRVIDTPDGLMLLSEAAEKSGLGVNTIKYRADVGWPVEHLFDPSSHATRRW